MTASVKDRSSIEKLSKNGGGGGGGVGGGGRVQACKLLWFTLESVPLMVHTFTAPELEMARITSSAMETY